MALSDNNRVIGQFVRSLIKDIEILITVQNGSHTIDGLLVTKKLLENDFSYKLLLEEENRLLHIHLTRTQIIFCTPRNLNQYMAYVLKVTNWWDLITRNIEFISCRNEFCLSTDSVYEEGNWKDE